MSAVFIGVVETIFERIFVEKEGGVFAQSGDEFKVVVEFVGDGRRVAVAEDEVSETGKNHDDDENRDGEDAENASVGIFREDAVPFFENIAETVGDEDGEREDDE